MAIESTDRLGWCVAGRIQAHRYRPLKRKAVAMVRVSTKMGVPHDRFQPSTQSSTWPQVSDA